MQQYRWSAHVCSFSTLHGVSLKERSPSPRMSHKLLMRAHQPIWRIRSMMSPLYRIM
jgi:hypothetical protein